MQFGNIHYLWMLWLVPLTIAFYIWAFRRKKVLIDRFVSPELRGKLLLGFSPKRQVTKATLIVTVLVLLVFALIRPKYGFHWEEVKRAGVDIVIALDVSQSMLAEDVSPNRLERAKREIIDLVNLIEGDRIGLVAFAGTAFLQCPLTLDYGAVQIFLDELDTNLIPIPGTAVAEALTKSVAAFDQDDKNSRVVILITDGEDHRGNPVKAAEKAATENVKLYAVGIGKDGGAPIPDPKGGFKKNRRGEVVMTKLDEDTLQKMALATGGSYVRSVTGNLDLERIYSDIRSTIDDKELQSGRRKRYEERYQWPLFLAILFLLLEMIIRENRLPTKQTKKRKRGLRFWKTSLATAVLLVLMPPQKTDAMPLTSKAQEGASAYEDQDYPEAVEKFLGAQVDDPSNLDLKFNLGSAYYQMGDFDQAASLFQDAAINGQPELAQKSYYNLGNVAFRQGKLQEAVQFYEKALAMKSDDEDAKHNLDFVRDEIKRRLEEQKKRQQNQQGQQNQDGEQQQQQQDKQQQHDDGQNKPQDQQDQEQNKGQDQEQEQESPQPPEDQPSPSENEQDATGEGSSDQGQKEQGEEEERAAARGEPTEGSMSEEEAQRWLDTIEGDRKDYLKRKFQGSKRYKVEKDW